MAQLSFGYNPGENLGVIANFLSRKADREQQASEFTSGQQQKDEDQALAQQGQQLTVEDQKARHVENKVRLDMELRRLEDSLITASLQQKDATLALETRRLDNELKTAQVKLVGAKTLAVQKSLGRVTALDTDPDDLGGMQDAPGPVPSAVKPAVSIISPPVAAVAANVNAALTSK